MLVPMKHEITVFKCKFCGTIHPDQGSAEKHGCLSGEPAQKFRINDIVVAEFTKGDGLSAVGKFRCKGRVVSIDKPRAHEPSWKLELSSINDRIGFSVCRNQHDWRVTVKPLDQPGGTSYVKEEQFHQDALEKDDSCKNRV